MSSDQRGTRVLASFARRLAWATSAPPEQTVELDTGEVVPSPDFSQAWADAKPENAIEVAAEVFDYLEGKDQNPGFDSLDDLLGWAWSLCDEMQGDGRPGWSKELVSRLTSGLAGNLDRYQFAVRFAPPPYDAPGAQRLNMGSWQLLGPQSLLIRPASDQEGAGGWWLYGLIPAGTRDGVARGVERIVDELCGALRCVGLCDFASVQDRRVPLTPTATVSGRMAREEALTLAPAATHSLFGTGLRVPPDLTEPERWQLKVGEVEQALSRTFRVVERLFWADAERNRELKAACRRIVSAELASDPGLTITLAFSCLEGLLLDPKSKSETLGRLGEAVAHSLGRTLDDRAELRRSVKRLYDVRSGFVHTGQSKATAWACREVLDLARRVIRRELELLPDPPVTLSELNQQ